MAPFTWPIRRNFRFDELTDNLTSSVLSHFSINQNNKRKIYHMLYTQVLPITENNIEYVIIVTVILEVGAMAF